MLGQVNSNRSVLFDSVASTRKCPLLAQGSLLDRY